jgi:hypothetical protein
MIVHVLAVLAILCACCLDQASAFQAASRGVSRAAKGGVTMEYIPDGLSKAQWAAIKKKEADDLKAKGNMGRLGTTRFKSRSFEAWQKSGGKHLFPVNPNTTPYEERPYMQRKNGDWEGADLESKGYKGAGQGAKSKRLVIDSVYESAKAAGKLDSASILGGLPLPWTSAAANKISNSKNGGNDNGAVKSGQQATAGRALSAKQLANKKAKLAKVVDTKGTVAAGGQEQPAKKKGLFGLF